MKKLLAVFLLVLHVSLALTLSTSFDALEGYTFSKYMRDFSKFYSASEYDVRRQIFERNLAEIKSHNAAGTHLYVKGVNHMTDWTEMEVSALNGARPKGMSRFTNKMASRLFAPTHRILPYQVDYRTSVPAVLTTVKNQGHCGSCWAHSAVESIESHWALATGRLHVLSQQQLTSCTPNPRHCGGTGGCFGAIESLAFEYVQSAGGIVEEWTYPYTSYYGSTGECKNITAYDAVAKLAGYIKLPANNQYLLMNAVAFRGPIGISIDASQWSSYAGGIFDGCSYTKNITVNHAVQLVGYGHDIQTKKDYWIIRNSWGPRWGENGYMRMLRESTLKCGWNVDAHSGSACDGDPDEEWVCGMCGILSDSGFPIVNTS